MQDKKNRKYSLLIGRWQPFHNGHKWLVDKTLNRGGKVCIGVMDTELSLENPYTLEERIEMIKRIYGNKVTVIPVPEIESINFGRDVGYKIIEETPPEHIKKISGTNIRSGIEKLIPEEIVEYLSLRNTTLWFTGLPCSGKTTLANKLKNKLNQKNYKTIRLDGDQVRHGLSSDLGFSEKDIYENLRRVAHVCNLINQSGNLAIASFVSPKNKMRKMIKDIVDNFKLIYVKCSLEKCIKRDTKGMYEKALKGEIKNFIGISFPFEEPDNPDFVVNTDQNDPEVCTDQIIKYFNF